MSIINSFLLKYFIHKDLITKSTYLLVIAAPKAQRAATKSFHFCRSQARVPIVPQVWWWLFSSCSPVRRQVIFGRPLFLFPSGVQCRAVLMLEPSSLRSTCPIHRQQLFIIIVAMSCLQRDSRSLLEILFGQNILSTPEVLGMECGQLGEVLSHHLSALCSVEVYWYNTAVVEF